MLALYRFAPTNSDISERAADVRSAAPSASSCRITGRRTPGAPLPVRAALQNSNCAASDSARRDATVKVKFPGGGSQGPDPLVGINPGTPSLRKRAHLGSHTWRWELIFLIDQRKDGEGK